MKLSEVFCLLVVMGIVIGIIALARAMLNKDDYHTERALTQSRLGTLLHKPFSSTDFLDEGKTNEVDAWGNVIVWEMESKRTSYVLLIRSFGKDGLPYTNDDMTVTKKYAIPTDEGESERFTRGLTRGFTKGIREGLKK